MKTGDIPAFRTYGAVQAVDEKNEEIVSEKIVDTDGRPRRACRFLKAAQADALICGGIGAGARSALASGDKTFPGVQGAADRAAADLIKGRLK
jgi:predicted Fe-Mo cluster-binding NifX family protein